MNATPGIRPWPHTGAILAGGHSHRMGTPKEGLRLPSGRAMIEHVLEPLTALCRQVVVIGHSRGYEIRITDTLLHVLDREPNLGPLGGLVTLFGSGLDTGYLVAACDQPLLTVDLLSRLTMGDPERPHLFYGPEKDDFHPFPGYYPASLLPVAQNLLAHGDRSLRAFAACADPVWVLLPPGTAELLLGINAPEQLRALERLYEMKDVPH